MPDLLSALGGTFSEESGLEKEEMWLDKQLLLSCRHGWVPAPVDFHHYIFVVIGTEMTFQKKIANTPEINPPSTTLRVFNCP